MNQQTKEFREKIADEFIKSLEEKQLDWKKNWKALSSLPQNAVTNATYRGLNRFNLTFLCNVNEWDDPRFATFKQISDAGWHLKKGSHGCKVEYWMPYNVEEKRVIPWKDADLKDKNVKLIAKYYHVFNVKDIEGIPPMKLPEKRNITPDKILDTICKNMDIEILNDGGDRAFYRPSEDKIHLPEAGYFESDYAYNSVALHELSHATGAAHRLNRNIQNLFGSPDYAFEELVAEISSTFMSQDLANCGNGFEMDNHKAYIQSWISAIKEKPEILMQAIKEANRVADYLEVAAELVKEQKLSKEEAFEIGADKVLEESEKLQQYNHLSAAEIKEDIRATINARITEYNQYNPTTPLELVDVEIYGSRSQGVHMENSDLDILVEYKGDIKESAFFNILHQEEYAIGGMKVDLNPIREEESGNIKDYLQRADAQLKGNHEAVASHENIIQELKRNGFRPTRNLVNNIQEFNAVTGRDNSLADICEMNKGKTSGLNPDAQDLLDKISSECRAQELAMALEQ